MSTVKLSDIVDALEMQFEGSQTYLDRRTGELIFLADEEIQAVEDEAPLESYPAWQQDTIRKARLVLAAEGSDYLSLPGKWDVDEYDMMKRFIRTIDDEELAARLDRAIQGKGAFRYFKDMIHECGVQDQWYQYRQQAMYETAVEWCREQQIDYTDDKKQP